MVEESKLLKRQVYTLLDMVGDIGGLHDGLFFIVGFFVTLYNAAKFESALVLRLFRFTNTPAATTVLSRIKKFTKADVLQISQDLGKQQLLKLPTCLILLSKMLCKSAFLSQHRVKLQKLRQANKKLEKVLDIKYILRHQQMTRLLVECLLSA
jgi:hypothetical protein